MRQRELGPEPARAPLPSRISTRADGAPDPIDLDAYGAVTYDAVMTDRCDGRINSAEDGTVLAAPTPSCAVVELTKPKMRGWLHLGAAPTAALAGLVLILIAPTQLRIPVAVYAASTVALFTISATYHRVNWRPSVRAIMQRVDHSAIFVLIAGSFTAVAASMVTGSAGMIMLIAAWIAAATGILGRLLWTSAPRWLFVPTYILFGASAMYFAPAMIRNGGVAVFTLIAVGGLLYVAGAVIFALRWPDPSPRLFGFHEIFHSFTLGGYISHYTAVLLAVTGAAVLA